MLYKTRGIALSYIKYKESSIIARIYTASFGMQSYIINGIRSKNAKTKIALFQPLTLLDLVVYHNNKKDIHRINEIKCNANFHSIPYDIRKTAIALFINEMLNKVLIEEGENEPLFEFLHSSFQYFDTVEANFENFHVQFLIQLSRYLGIFPVSAVTVLKEIGHAKANDGSFVEQIDFFIQSGFDQHQKLNKNTRNEILMVVINYYRFHFDAIKEFKSIQVLREVLS